MKITPSLFHAHIKCPTKCWLRFSGEPAAGNAYAGWVQTQNESFCVDSIKRLLAETPQEEYAITPAAQNLKSANWRLAVDVPLQIEFCSSRGSQAHSPSAQSSTFAPQPCDQSVLTSGASAAESPSQQKWVVESGIHAIERLPPEGRGKSGRFIPIRFVFTNKLGKDEKLLLAFDAFVLSEILGREVSLGKIIHGDNHATLKVKTSALTGEVRQRLNKIATLLSSTTPPDLVLNRHCAECEFQARCRQKAIEKDELSLLGGLNEKDRKKLHSKGIFTITQLSYTFRPRRRLRRLRDKREKYHHSLKALAIREKKIHIVGSPELKIAGTPVYLDVEGLPDRDFYYLIGVRIGDGESTVQHSLWANTAEDEGKIWREFLGILETVEKPMLVHYGSYEKTFLKEMKERHGEPPEESAVAKCMQANVNLLLHNFAQIYLTGISNGLKDTAGSLGFKWGEAGASGLNAIVWRCQWEELHQAIFKERLIAYNTQDCEALSLVTNRILQLTSQRTADESSQTENADVVRVDAKEFQWKQKWNVFKSPVSGFEYINEAAHWDYQRHRVYARSGKAPKKPAAPRRVARNYGLSQLAIRLRASWWCPKCKIRGQFKDTASKTVHDIVFGRQSLKLRAVKYVFRTYQCQKCRGFFGLAERFSIFRRYGWDLVVYLIYQVIELNIPQHTVVRGFNEVFHFDLHKNTLNHMKVRVGKYYTETRQKILANIVRGSLVHADETRANIKGKTGFVWVLTNMNEVFYTLAHSREGDMIQKLLPDFKGVLVSDFYTAYDSIGCPQQRCLIHLMRDLNDEILDDPFDDQLKKIVTAFGVLLRPMIETVDRYGLKKHFLKKHLIGVERFYRELEKTDWQSEAALKCKDRFERNRDKLFTFLNYDGVPWNNNNAEHAIKAFARVRDLVGGASTEKGLEEYLTLLSVCQTCKYMGVNFLDFLRSGEKEIHAFAESRCRRKRRSPASQGEHFGTCAIE